ncbi:MAG TPA: fluoride efflux transporter CrcB [Solirubrobacteraceae bacterium]|jgi:CrcB protein|nr:fluoride efflux transporter CrcB [Solirubrobacteraceae bacterium]
MSFVALWLGVGVLGGLGAIARFLLDAFVSVNTGARFPLGTLLVNLSGALVLGLLVGLALSGDAYLLAGTAVIGSYTTFSTWMLESHRLAEGGQRWLLWANIALSLALGVGAAALGRLLGGG